MGSPRDPGGQLLYAALPVMTEALRSGLAVIPPQCLDDSRMMLG
jgi:hypothetical protein